MVTGKTRTGSVFILSVAFAALSATSVWAGDESDYRPPQPNPGVTAGSGLPSVIPGIGTYAGSISALRVPGAGIYFMVERSGYKQTRPHLAPKARIIKIKAGDSACRYEAGVCVIRP